MRTGELKRFARIVSAVAALMLVSAATSSPARAASDLWGCSYDKCVAYCTKVAGKNCTARCNKWLADKRKDGVCK